MGATGHLDLLQITLIVRDLPATEKAFQEALGLEVAFRDPGVDLWGLENVVLPMGRTFIEILAPTRENTPGGRHLDRHGGDGGYMVILQTHDVAPWRARIEELGIRIAFELKTEEPAEGDSWEGIHLHPSDTGGMMISFDNPQPITSWAGAGPDWREYVRQDVVDGLVSITLRSPDPERLAARWGEVLDRVVVSERGVDRIDLDQGFLEFEATREGELEGLARIDLHATDRARVGETIPLGGVDFRLV